MYDEKQISDISETRLKLEADEHKKMTIEASAKQYWKEISNLSNALIKIESNKWKRT